MNTHAIFKKLLTHGFSEEQAEGITEAISEVKPDPELYVRKELFEVSETKIHDNNNDIAIMKGDIVEIKLKLGKIESNIDSLEKNMDLKFDAMEKNIDAKLGALENRMLTWGFVLFSGTIASIIVPIFLKYYG